MVLVDSFNNRLGGLVILQVIDWLVMEGKVLHFVLISKVRSGG